MEDIRYKLGYAYHQEIEEIETEFRKNNPSATETEVYFGSIQIYQENHANDPSLKERQKKIIIKSEKETSFTREELEYIAGKLAGSNEPIGQDILEKIGKMI